MPGGSGSREIDLGRLLAEGYADRAECTCRTEPDAWWRPGAPPAVPVVIARAVWAWCRCSGQGLTAKRFSREVRRGVLLHMVVTHPVGVLI